MVLHGDLDTTVVCGANDSARDRGDCGRRGVETEEEERVADATWHDGVEDRFEYVPPWLAVVGVLTFSVKHRLLSSMWNREVITVKNKQGERDEGEFS